MVLLESYDRFDDLVELEPTTGQVRWYSKRDNPNMATLPIQGAVSQLNGHMVFLYREADVLHFRVDDIDIELTEDTRIELIRGNTNVLTMLRGDAPIFRLEYKPYVADEIDKWRMYLNPFIEEEDFDFGLFVYNVLKDPRRRADIYR
jgi:hypothetical protein